VTVARLEPPPGFTLPPGTERAVPGHTTHVFGVARDGQEHVCKRLGARALDEPWVREQLVAEGRLLELLGGRGAPRLVASGEDAGGPWIVMVRIAWPTLASQVGRRDARWMESAARAAFEALAVVHAAGVVHGDVSPENVLVSDDGARAVLVDFGLARAPSRPLMPAGPFRGTLVYAAPEVARGEPFDGRADLFSMAASLLHVWSGEAPRPPGPDAAMLVAAGEQGIEAWAERAARFHVGQALAPEVARMLVTRCSFDAKDRVA
jgi:serine/threonine protein kinase